jgi:hypothetical protein
VKKIKRKSFLLVEVLIAFLLVALLLSSLVQVPSSLYKSLKMNQKKLHFYLERKIFIHDLMLHLDQKKTLKNGETIQLNKKNFSLREGHIFFNLDPEDTFCKLKIFLHLISEDGVEDESEATLVVKTKK